jgi:hypothetical protein
MSEQQNQTTETQIQTITIDDKTYPLSQFSPRIVSMVALREVWSNQANVERAALTKTEAALRQLDTELLQMCNTELEEQAKAEAEQVVEPAPEVKVKKKKAAK